MGHGLVLPEIVESPVGTGRWMVVVYDNDTTAFEDVVSIIMRATGCSANEAYIETWEAQSFGRPRAILRNGPNARSSPP